MMTLLCAVLSTAWGAEATTTYVFGSRDWAATCNNVSANWTVGLRAGGFTDGQGIQITSSSNGANATSPKSFSNVSKIVVTYCTNNKAGAGDIKLQIGNNTEQSFSVTAPSSGGGTTLKTKEFTYDTTESGQVKITVDCTKNSIYIYSIAITETVNASIEVSPGYIEAEAAETTGTLTVTKNNIATGLNVLFYEADGTTEAEQPSWFTYNLTYDSGNDYNLSYTIAKNESEEARATYFKFVGLHPTDITQRIYSNLISVTQAGHFEIQDGIFNFAEYGYDMTQDNDGYNPNPTTLVAGNVTIKLSGSNNSRYYLTTKKALELRVYSESEMTVSVPLGKKITKIEFEGNKVNNKIWYSETESVTDGIWTGNSQEVTFTFTDSQQISKITVTYEAGEDILVVEPYTVDLTAEGGSGSLSLATNIDLGTVTTTSIYYCDANGSSQNTYNSKYPWLSLENDGKTAINYTVAANEGDEARSAYFKVKYNIYGGGSLWSDIVTINQEAPLHQVTIAEARAMTVGSEVWTAGTVTGVSGSTAYIQDATAAICVYGASGLTVGDNITVSGTLATYNGLLEITNPTCEVVSQGNEVQPTMKSIAEINADYASNNALQAMYVAIVDARVTDISGDNTTIDDNGNTIVVRGLTDVEENDIVTLTGNVGCYNIPQIVNPTVISVYKLPVLTVSPETVNVPFNGGEGELEITASNLSGNVVRADIKFYDENEEEIDQPSWITVNVDYNENTITYTVEPNEGEARTAYFKVAYGTPLWVYSDNMVTIKQEAQVSGTTYAKVTSTSDITNGKYLIVYEGDATHGSVAFDGSLETLDAVNNTQAVTIADDKIFTDLDIYFTINTTDGSIQSASGKYIGVSSYDNGLKQSDDTPYANSISIDADGNAVITVETNKGTMTLRYNYASNQNRFRYYKSGQQAIQLYKAIEEQTVEPFELTISSKAGDGNAFYATMSNLGDGNFTVPEGVEVATIVIENKKIQKTATFKAGDVIPGSEAYLVESATAGSFNFTPTDAEATSQLGENWLYPAIAGETITAPDETREYKFYQLSLNGSHADGSVGFYYGPTSTNGEAFAFTSEHKAYLAVPQDEQPTGAAIGLFDGTTAISGIAAGENGQHDVYTLTGVRVSGKQLPKGIYIVGGKKTVVK